MARTGGDKTRKKILDTAEKLFAKRGFDATSVDLIAKTAGVNKALIYYHFKNKEDLVLCLFQNIMEEVAEHASIQKNRVVADTDLSEQQEIRQEVEFLADKKRILQVMMSEALRANQRDDFLFRCAEIVIQKEHGKDLTKMTSAEMVHEFFTGFIPLLSFVALKDKWCTYFGYSKDRVTDDFIEAFFSTHMRSHSKQR